MFASIHKQGPDKAQLHVIRNSFGAEGCTAGGSIGLYGSFKVPVTPILAPSSTHKKHPRVIEMALSTLESGKTMRVLGVLYLCLPGLARALDAGALPELINHLGIKNLPKGSLPRLTETTRDHYWLLGGPLGTAIKPSWSE